MIYDHGLLDELGNFINILKRYDKLYIYGAAHNQKMLAKYLDICGISTRGFVTSETLGDIAFPAGAGVILGLSDKYYNEAYPRLVTREKPIDVIFLSERAKHTISYKVTPRQPDEYNIEINLADHCNLNCQMCDHFSQLVKEPCFLDIDECERDLNRLSELSGGRLGIIKLLGGEPLLNEDIVKCLKTVRRYFADTPVWIYTNGLLLLSPRMEAFWTACKEYDCAIELTPYPMTGLDIMAIRRKAAEREVDLRLTEVCEKYSLKYQLSAHRLESGYAFVDCYQKNHCNVLKNGKIYACPMSAYIHYFNEYFNRDFRISESDHIDIHETSSFEEIAEFASRPVPFCGYCDIAHREFHEWKRSERLISEYI
ncbi:MAG: hypothetical protein LBP30_02675 [Clostridiales Family XIII bacterium]|jgi:MoaA/NifB/PqqE/SkfB family radical SAM enzyme|nr:hypothetical protein [Clostridiales Family XIII bacterium]